ncbi:hypothetical protein [uncultured Psychrobacter sp.]|uniref:hypothetical protein n=1 Tax=uncultured Psychrobacter sp. TaxID=259303 RepID=UPI0030DDB4F8
MPNTNKEVSETVAPISHAKHLYANVQTSDMFATQQNQSGDGIDYYKVIGFGDGDNELILQKVDNMGIALNENVPSFMRAASITQLDYDTPTYVEVVIEEGIVARLMGPNTQSIGTTNIVHSELDGAVVDEAELESSAAIAIKHLQDAILLIKQGKNDDALAKLYHTVKNKVFSNENAGGKVYTVRYNPAISEEAYGIIKEYCPQDEVSGEDDSDLFSMNLISNYFLEEHGEMFGELSEEDVNILFSIQEDYIEI